MEAPTPVRRDIGAVLDYWSCLLLESSSIRSPPTGPDDQARRHAVRLRVGASSDGLHGRQERRPVPDGGNSGTWVVDPRAPGWTWHRQIKAGCQPRSDVC